MLRKISILCLIATAILITNAYSVSAQTSELRGRVTTKDSSGKEVPVAEAQIDVFRTDLPGEYKTKTDKKGNFVFAGLPFVGRYIISISAPGMAPQARGDIRADGQDKTFTLFPGDGKRFTKDEAKQSAAGSAPVSGGQETAEQKKEREEFEKKTKEINEKNKKATESNATINKSLQDGNASFEKKDYNGAIAHYNIGIEVDAEHPGVPVLLTNKALALRFIAIDKFNNAGKTKDTVGLEESKKDIRDAVEASVKAVTLLKSLKEQTTDAERLKGLNANLYNALSGRAESLRLYVKMTSDQSRAEEAFNAYQEYLEVEIEPVKKANAQLSAATVLFDAGISDKALVEFKKLIEIDPNNYAAYRGAGLVLINMGYAANDNVQLQEAANYLQLFVDKSPDTNPEKAEAKSILETLKNEQKIKPQKATTPTKKKGN